ncbi:MAG TPA: hypothetical protein VMW52_10565, partial [Phycisphaerae bacterium]|nr:hypothetical protein [Phycisphaerae bacterium]
MSHLRLEDSSFSSGILKAQGLTSLLGNSISTFLANPLLGVANMAKQALGGIKDLVMGTAKAADEFAKMAKATGVGIEFLSGMRHAAELSGTSMDSVRQSLVFLARGAADTAEGTGAAAGAFQELGITVTNADGSLKGAQQLFLESAEALSQVDDETKRTALTMDIFGRGAGSMIPLLLEGKEGIEGMVAEAKALGLTFDEAGGKA